MPILGAVPSPAPPPPLASASTASETASAAAPASGPLARCHTPSRPTGGQQGQRAEAGGEQDELDRRRKPGVRLVEAGAGGRPGAESAHGARRPEEAPLFEILARDPSSLAQPERLHEQDRVALADVLGEGLVEAVAALGGGVRGGARARRGALP